MMNTILNSLNSLLHTEAIRLMPDIVVKSTVLLLLAIVADRITRGMSAAIRHRVWCLAFCSLLLLPILMMWLPALHLPILPAGSQQPVTAQNTVDRGAVSLVDQQPVSAAVSYSSQAEASGRTGSDRAEVTDKPEITAAPPSAPAFLPQSETSPVTRKQSLSTIPWATMLGTVWLAGAVLTLLPLLTGIIRNVRLQRRASTMQNLVDSPWFLLLCQQLNLNRKVQLLESGRPIVPITSGVLRPTVIIPATWRSWTDERKRLVLLHELAHIKRFDVAWQMVARLSCSIFWFHPMVWYALHRMRTDREIACDDCVLTAGIKPSVYARELVDMVKNHQPLRWPAVVAMAQTTDLEARVRCLLNKARSHMPLSRSRAYAMFASSALLAIGIAVSKPAAQNINLPLQDTPEYSEDDVVLNFKGCVVNPEGEPIAGAKLFFVYQIDGQSDQSLKPQAVSGNDGSFEFQSRLSDIEPRAKLSFYARRLAAVADGYGMGMTSSVWFETTGLAMKHIDERTKEYYATRYPDPRGQLRLTKDVPLQGQIVNTEGQPVKGAELNIDNWLWHNPGGNLDGWEADARKPGADVYSIRENMPTFDYGSQLSAMIPPVRTDDNGRFEIRGIGAERVVKLFLRGPGIAAAEINVRTRKGDPIELPAMTGQIMMSNMNESPKDIYHPAEFTHVAAASRPVTGRLIDADSGEPLKGVSISAGRPFRGFVSGRPWLSTKTDENGRYRLDGLPRQGIHPLYVETSVGSGYIPATRTINTRSEDDEMTADFELRKGIVVQGQVNDAETGKPVKGTVRYFADAQNVDLSRYADAGLFDYRTDHEGRFTVPVLPGKGILTFTADQHFRYQVGIGADQITVPGKDVKAPDSGILANPMALPGLRFLTVPGNVRPSGVSVLAEINLARGDAAPDITLKPVPLSAITGTLVDPDGKIISSGQVRTKYGGGLPVFYDNREHTLRIEGYTPAALRRIWLYHVERDLVGYLHLKGEQPSKIEIKMQPAAGMRGRLVDQGGAPISGAMLSGDGVFSESWGSLEERVTTDENGLFHVRGLIPGHKYTIGASNSSRTFYLGTIVDQQSVDEAVVKDLGDVKPEPSRR